MKQRSVGWIAGILAVVVWCALLTAAYWIGNTLGKSQADRSRVVVTAGREATVRIVDEMLARARVDDLIMWLSVRTRSTPIAAAVITSAHDRRVPLGIVVGIAEVESQWVAGAVGAQNADGSVDRGIMGLNSTTFRKMTLEQIMDPACNVRSGVAYLSDQKTRFGSWEAAIIAYNHGNADRPPERTISYLSRVLSYEREFDGEIAAMFGSFAIE